MPQPGPLQQPNEERTQLAMLRLFFEQSGVSLVAAALLVVVHLAFAVERVAAAWLWAWACVFGLLIALRLHWRQSLLRLDDAALAAGADGWRRRAEAGAAMTGLLWAVAIAMVFDVTQQATQMYAAMLACITCVASINVMAPLPRAFLALLLPVALALAARFAMLGGAAGWYDAALALAGSGLATALLLRHTRLLHESHALRFEREALLAQTQQARSAQVRFLAAASHDLRQPVHALGLLAAQAQAELQGRRAAATAAQLQAMAQALDGLVDSLMDVSRLDGGGISVEPRPMPLQDLLDRLAPEYAVLAEDRGLQWRLHPTTLWVRSDPQQLERMLRNLLSNALTHTRKGGVLLAARPRQGKVRIAVWDTGPGIAPEHHARIFEEFVQLDNPGRDRRRGHGLGLAIVARLARLLDHPVSLSSRPGRGSCFSLVLPRVEAGQHPTPDPVVWPVAPLKGLRVALVEDDEAVRQATADLLLTWGCEVWAGESAEPVLTALRAARARPDRIVSDWCLSRADGLTAIQALREGTDADAPALLISGQALPLDGRELDRRGITPARKPLPAAALRAWLSSPVSPPI